MKYYDIKDDLKAYPDAWCYLVWSKRGPGKTYSTLRYCIENNVKFVFIKRTIEDVKMLCASGKRKDIEFDVSPFVPLNRDFGWNIAPVKVEKGLAGFYHCNEQNEPAGKPVGYCVALSIAADVKGFDMSECDLMIFDEFIPKRYERINREEGDALLDIYMTITRDRIERGKEELKLICLANATSINNPTFIVLDVMDKAAEMDVKNTEYFYNERRIMMHKIPPVLDKDKKKLSGIEIAMAGTTWAEMAFGGSFSYDDFSNVQHTRLKGYQPLCAYTYKKKDVYIYMKDGYYYATYAKNKCQLYNLNRENDQKRFFFDYVGRLKEACISERMKFESYSMYDLIINYKKIFNI